LFSPPERKIRKYVSSGIAVSDVGCGPGHFNISMAEAVGPKGKVYAAGSDPKSIEVLKTKSKDKGFQKLLTLVPFLPRTLNSFLTGRLILLLQTVFFAV
jgi:ubiquinone/menaquinone biosynthesis C-methylase UbiE